MVPTLEKTSAKPTRTYIGTCIQMDGGGKPSRTAASRRVSTKAAAIIAATQITKPKPILFSVVMGRPIRLSVGTKSFS